MGWLLVATVTYSLLLHCLIVVVAVGWAGVGVAGVKSDEVWGGGVSGAKMKTKLETAREGRGRRKKEIARFQNPRKFIGWPRNLCGSWHISLGHIS
jgi:hypothetical protein